MLRCKLQKALENQDLIGIYYGQWKINNCRVLEVSSECVEVECSWQEEGGLHQQNFIVAIGSIVAIKNELRSLSPCILEKDGQGKTL